MIPEDRLLSACARQHFTPLYQDEIVALCSHESIQWRTVYSAATRHGIAPLVYANLQKCTGIPAQIPDEIACLFRNLCGHVLIRKEWMARQTANIARALHPKGISIMVVKGMALDITVYHRPWYTISSDVDLIFDKKREDVSVQDQSEIWSLIRDLQCFEPGYWSHHDLTMSGTLSINFSRLWQDASKTELAGQPVFILSPEDSLIAACIASCRRRYIKLKTHCDIAEIVRHYQNMKWSQVIAKAREYRCCGIVYAGLLMAKMAVGAQIPTIIFDRLNVSRCRADAIDYLSRRIYHTSPLYSGSSEHPRQSRLPLILSYVVCGWTQAWRGVLIAAKTRYATRY